MSQPGSDLSRNLRNRHIQLIAIGGTIGTGLFLGSAKAIHSAGPALILAYALGGVAIFFIMRALGELLTYRPVAGSFATYADEFCGPLPGFITGWSYWFAWVVTGMAELTAIGKYVGFWYPTVPQWLPALVALLALYGSNLLAVRVFGELEFWFALIKVVTIVGLIVGGLAVILFHVGDLGTSASFANLWSHGGFLPFGILGMLLTMQIVMFAYEGVELIGVTAGEALRSWIFWGLAIAFFLDVIAINGTLTHIVPLLTDRGIPRQVATAALSGTGFALIFGRILSGWCLDRLWGPYVAIAFFVLPMIGIAILISGAEGIAPFLGAIACGLGIGAEIDLMAFFTSRYFGLRDYAKLYGTMFGIFALGVGIGPAVSGASFDRFHSYTPAFVIFVIMLAVGCFIFLRLGPYPFPALGQALSGGAEKMPA